MAKRDAALVFRAAPLRVIAIVVAKAASITS